MTEVAFHFNAPGMVVYGCRLLRKAVASGARVVVTGQPALLRELDVALWTFAPLEFIAHCDASAGDAVLARSPVVLAASPRLAPHQQVLVNLGGPVPEGFERFERLLEVVSPDDDDRLQARQRWKHYADRGYAIARHDLAQHEARLLMAAKTPPRYVPTLTDVVGVPTPAPSAVDGLLAQEQLVHRVMQRIDLTLDRRLREAVATTVLEQTRLLGPLLREEIETVVRQTVSQALAEELALAAAPPVQGQ